MIDTPTVTRTDDRPVAILHLTVPAVEIRDHMGPGISEVYRTLADQGITPAGPWLTHHVRRPTDVFDFDICVPVTRPVTAAGRVKPGVLPAATVARTVYTGPYEGLAAAWGELMAWVEQRGHTSREDLWEVYVVGPESVPDPNRFRTELNRPLTRIAS